MKITLPFLLTPILFILFALPFLTFAQSLDCPEGQIPCTYSNGALIECHVGPTCPDENDAVASDGPRGLVNPLNVGSLRELTLVLFDVIKTLLEIVLVAAIVWTGWKFISAQGKEKEIMEARKMLGWTLLGGAMVLGINVIYEILVATIDQL